MKLGSEETHYRMCIASSLTEIGEKQWDALIQAQPERNPFLSYAFLSALHESGSASTRTGWTPCFITLWKADLLVAAMPLYKKTHSYGEYVFDHAWAHAYHQHGYIYYPKLLSAIPFTPVSGNRLLASNLSAKTALIQAVLQLCDINDFSSVHILFPTASESDLLKEQQFMLRSGVQFHWQNQGYRDFDEFLAVLDRKKRKNIKAERRKVQEAEIQFRHISGNLIKPDDWQYFKQCYDNTYSDHHSSPYLNLDFFLMLGQNMPDNVHMIVAERLNSPIAASLLIYDKDTVFGRYWGCTESFPCLHFETAYYQAIEFCIRMRIATFEGGAQGEHKMARGFLPQKTWSAHYIRHSAFADAVSDFLDKEQDGIADYIDELNDRTPYKQETRKGKQVT
ncbi:MAG: N-acetyltransferase [Burkholderiales bacterium]|nr:N-acetyltransferase [Burkholderiales bacterium]